MLCNSNQVLHSFTDSLRLLMNCSQRQSFHALSLKSLLVLSYNSSWSFTKSTIASLSVRVSQIDIGHVNILVFIYLFGVLHRFQHCTGHITTSSWKGRGDQYIQFVRRTFLYHNHAGPASHPTAAVSLSLFSVLGLFSATPSSCEFNSSVLASSFLASSSLFCCCFACSLSLAFLSYLSSSNKMLKYLVS